MFQFIRIFLLAGALAAIAGPVAADPNEAGRQVFEQRCRTCHGGPRSADSPLGPVLTGVVGAKAGTRPHGVHSRALAESGIVWDRAALRRFLADPQGMVPGTLMPVRVENPGELEHLLDYLERVQ